MKIARVILVAIAISAGAIACRETNTVSYRREAEITDSAGIRRVLNYEKGWGAGEEWTVSAEPVLRIGLLDGPREFLFDRIAGVTRLSDGTIVVLNAGDGQLRFFSRDGSHLRSVGGIGGGPG